MTADAQDGAAAIEAGFDDDVLVGDIAVAPSVTSGNVRAPVLLIHFGVLVNSRNGLQRSTANIRHLVL